MLDALELGSPLDCASNGSVLLCGAWLERLWKKVSQRNWRGTQSISLPVIPCPMGSHGPITCSAANPAETCSCSYPDSSSRKAL